MRQSLAAGQALARLGIEFAACYSSPLVRARGTADRACRTLGIDPVEHEELGMDFDVDAARDPNRPLASSLRVLALTGAANPLQEAARV